MFFQVSNALSKKRVTKSGSTDSLDRPFPKKGFASILKKDEPKFIPATQPVSPHCPSAWALRMRGIA
jgi:hypothetical protein